MSARISRIIPCVVALVLAAGAIPARAEDPAESTDQFESKLTAGLVVTEQYNDNIFASRALKTPDGITVISPALNLRIQDSRAELNLGGSAAFSMYAENTGENTQDFDLYANSRYQLSPVSLFVAGSGYARKHEDRSSPDEVFGDSPTIYYDTSAYAAIQNKSGPFTVKAGGTFDYLNFEDVDSVGGIVNNDDRDRDVATAGVRVSYDLNTINRIFASLSYDLRSYRSALDDAGFDRDSQGLRASAGVQSRLSNSLSTEAYAGLIYQSYDDARFSDVVSPNFGGRLTWTPLDGLSVRANLERSLQETTILDASGYLQTSASLSFVQWLRPDIRLDGGIGYYDNDYQDISRHDEIVEAWLAVRRYISSDIYIGANYVFTSRDSTVIGENYDQSVIMARVGRTMDPAYSDGALSDPSVPPVQHSGAYIGVKTGHVGPETKLQGERGNGGTLDADFGDHGFAGGGFVGYGIAIGDWHVALEADVTGAAADWDHSRSPGGRVFSVDRQEAYGLSAIFGRYLNGGAMVYGRAGAVLQKFDTQYRPPNDSFQRDDTLLGLRIGVGGSVALSDRLSLRMEYDYTTFGDYEIGPRRGPDVFANNESAAWLGLSYSFLPNAAASKTLTDVAWNGFYWGVQVGGDAINSVTTGDRDAGSTLVADFGDTGVSGGLFAGYGRTLGGFFIAGELEADLSAASWGHLRQPAGRIFSIEKQGSIGAGVKVGYLVNDAALVYGSLGVAHSFIDIGFERGSHALNIDESKTALRYGMGMELPATRNLAIRLDYTFTDYGTLDLISAPNGDIETYDTSESLFRIGSVFRY